MPKLETKVEVEREDLRAIIRRLSDVVESLEEVVKLIRCTIPQILTPDDTIPF